MPRFTDPKLQTNRERMLDRDMVRELEMPNKKTRVRSTRRDRRKAKQSGYRRPGRKNSTKKGHG